MNRNPMSRDIPRPWAAAAALACLLFLLLAGAERARAAEPTPTLAYYYIWFDPSSWSRAKTDYPLLGHYSSDERAVMRQHVVWAKEAGLDGFIVSWKSTPLLNARLERLVRIADEEDFKLAIIYQGLDFARQPLPVARIASDLEYFADSYGGDPAFQIFDRPLVVWSGTPEFSAAQIASVTRRLRSRLLILASEHDPVDYRRLADAVDGEAYYWSSVDPATFPHYPERLAGFGRAVHAHDGLWIAPAAPGFDARLVGGTSVVSRKDGATFRLELDAAQSSSPDAIGVISWNEFSENSHIEPSERYGGRYLAVLADVLGARAPVVEDFDSDAPAATGVGYGIPLLLGLGLVVFGGMTLRRASRNRAGARAKSRRSNAAREGAEGR